MSKLQLKSFNLPFPQRNVKKQCEICLQNFGMTLREHVCKRCFRSVCDNCSPYKVRSYKADLQHRLHRMCTKCHQQSQILNKYVSNNKISWGEDSDMCRMWLKQLGYNNRTSMRVSTARTTNSLLDYQISLNDLWKSLNFSFRQFLGIAIDKSKKSYKQIKQELQDCIYEIMTTMVNHGFDAQQIIYILMFFLAHSSPNNAILFTKSLMQMLSCQQPSTENILHHLERLNCSQIQCYKLQSYLEDNLTAITKTVTINYFTAQISIEILSSLISKKSYQELEKGIAYILSIRKQFITKNINKPQAIIIDILKNTGGIGINFRKAIKQIDDVSVNGVGSKKSQFGFSDISSTKYQDVNIKQVFKQNQQLKIKNRNQEEEIQRLRSQNNRLVQQQNLRKQQLQQKDAWSKIRKKSIAIQKITKQQKNICKSPRKSILFPTYQDSSDFDRIEDESQYRDSRKFMKKIKKNSLQMKLDVSEWEYQDRSSQTQSEKQQDKTNSNLRQRFTKIFEEEQQTTKQISRMIQFNKVMQQLIKRMQKQRKIIPIYCYHQRKGRIKYLNDKRMIKKRRQNSPSKIHKENRMTTYSQKLIKMKDNKDPFEQEKQIINLDYEDIIYRKNQEIAKLKKQLQIHQYNNAMLQKQIAQNQISTKQDKDIKEIGSLKISQKKQSKQDDNQKQAKLKEQLRNMKQMNRKLIIKMKQLSNMLMDKQQEEVGYSDKSFEELTRMYSQQVNNKEQQCIIF